MFSSFSIVLLAIVIVLQLLVPACFIGRAITRGELRVRFTLRSLFFLVTIVAASLGIARLPLPWPVRLATVWGILVCAFGLALARRPQFPSKLPN